MSFWQKVLAWLDTSMPTPTLFGWFHCLWLGITIAVTVLFCVKSNHRAKRRVRHVLFWTTLMVILFEIYKQINFSFSYENGITFDYQWYAFPFQFCSTPMYAGLLASTIRRGKIHDAMCAYLATYSVFAGLCVMLYPGDVYISTIGINIQTMFCHGSMIVLGVFLMYTGYVKLQHSTILKAIPVFVGFVTAAAIMNEIAYRTGLLETENFNMFLFSPYCDPSLPVYSLVQERIAFPWCLLIYIAMFTLAAYLILLFGMLFRYRPHPRKKVQAEA